MLMLQELVCCCGKVSGIGIKELPFLLQELISWVTLGTLLHFFETDTPPPLTRGLWRDDLQDVVLVIVCDPSRSVGIVREREHGTRNSTEVGS